MRSYFARVVVKTLSSTNAIDVTLLLLFAYARAGFANPCFTQIHPTCIPVAGDHQSKLTLMSESLRNDGRVWVPKNAEDCNKNPNDISEDDRDYYLEESIQFRKSRTSRYFKSFSQGSL